MVLESIDLVLQSVKIKTVPRSGPKSPDKVGMSFWVYVKVFPKVWGSTMLWKGSIWILLFWWENN